MARFSSVLLSSLLFVVPNAADAAEDEPLWNTIGDWQIRVDRTLDFGCFMMASYERGDVLRVGFNPQNQNGYLIVGNDAWHSLEIGKQYELNMQFDDESPWNGTAKAVNIGGGGTVFLYLTFDKPGFMNDLAVKQSMSFYYQGREVTTLPLTGTYAAIQGLIECQKQVDEAKQSRTQSGSDPFAAGRNGNSADPFAH